MKRVSRGSFFRFRLHSLFVLVTIFLIMLGLVMRELHREHRRQQAASEVQRLGGMVRYRGPRQPSSDTQKGVVKAYLQVLLGDAFFKEITDVYLKMRSEEDLNLVFDFHEVKSLSLTGSTLSVDSLERLRSLSQLRGLSLSDVILNEQGVNEFTKLPNLIELRFSNSTLTGHCFQALAERSKLIELQFNNCSLSEECLKSLKQFTKLHVSFVDCALTDEDLRLMHGSRSTGRLSLTRTKVTEAGLLAIREANPDWSMHLTVSADNALQLPSIQEIQQVKELAFQGPLTSDLTLAFLKDASSLTSLKFKNCSITDRGLQNLQSIQNLRALSISSAPITDEGLRELEGLRQIEFLNLDDTKVVGLRMGNLPPSIKRLAVDVGDSGVAEIAKLKNLQELVLFKSQLSEAGISALASMNSLERMYILETPISDASLGKLQQALPNCKILTEY